MIRQMMDYNDKKMTTIHYEGTGQTELGYGASLLSGSSRNQRKRFFYLTTKDGKWRKT